MNIVTTIDNLKRFKHEMINKAVSCFIRICLFLAKHKKIFLNNFNHYFKSFYKTFVIFQRKAIYNYLLELFMEP